MTTYGVTPEGFVVKPLEQIQTDVAAKLRARLSPTLNLTTASPLGNPYLIFCEELAQAWEVAEAIGATWDPDSAIGTWLDNLSAITGSLRKDATKSTVNVNVTTDQAVNVAAGDFVGSVAGNETARFVNTVAIVAAGAGTASFAFEAEEVGPTVANSGTLTVIETPTAGITAITNPADAALGTNIETNDELRARRLVELSALGAGTVETIRSTVAKVAGVLDAVVFENTTDATDGSGRPPHSVHVVVEQGTSTALAVATAIFESKPAGIATHGSQSQAVVDSRGASHTIKWDWATAVNIYVRWDLDIIAAEFPSDGVAQLKALAVAFGDALFIGRDVIAEKIRSLAWQIPGVYNLTAFKLDTVTPPVASADITITATQVADFDTARITVNTNPVTPG